MSGNGGQGHGIWQELTDATIIHLENIPSTARRSDFMIDRQGYGSKPDRKFVTSEGVSFADKDPLVLEGEYAKTSSLRGAYTRAERQTSIAIPRLGVSVGTFQSGSDVRG